MIDRLRVGACASLLAGLLALTGACQSSDRAAKEQYELAQFEERQGNVPRARDLYQEIVSKYPDTSWGKQAAERLSTLQGADP